MKPDTSSLSPARRDLARPALSAFFNICDKWRLTSDQTRTLLGRPPRSTFYRWRRVRTGVLTHDALERISCVLGIYKALHILFVEPAQADGWIKRANLATLFDGGSALDRMLGGQVADLSAVRQYLDSQCGWA
ncbi:MAG: DUF2384 domain-containing protein [Arenimonas sp. SCN 70-307]|uniref:antitoxin Xre-like helix-turn-helix domain-containing protein n=1 Tax=Arenimonas sp. SCN 70-307 TaxID=1660089 RepID=UPI00086C7E3F|nr:antitoxin Xre-like helix-turn-helix domain-containing protein [Arenimonas sp. SCN 70-307]ODS64076.1 MAG: DUF2384 domain-containing protein [Arenimonas sp. SCN 70-307]